MPIMRGAVSGGAPGDRGHPDCGGGDALLLDLVRGCWPIRTMTERDLYMGARLTPKAILTCCLFWAALAFPAIWLLEWLFS